MEISRKYSLEDIENLAAAAGFRMSGNYFDQRRWFVNSLWEK
jgi:uncharacterized SAM-dependent methyltransferase